MTELSEHEILWNSAALSSLRRPQLVSLSKKYGLRASGKNVEMAGRLYDFGQTLTPNAKTAFDMAAATVVDTPTRTRTSPRKRMTVEAETTMLAPPQPPALTPALKTMASTRTLGDGPESWELLTRGNTSIDNESARPETIDEDPNSTRAWKSAVNGEPLDDFAATSKENRYGELRVGVLRSVASSIKRTASRTLSGRHKTPTPGYTGGRQGSRQSTPGPAVLFPGNQEVYEKLTGSPASAIGVPKRHETVSANMSLHHRASTIRMVSPSPALALELERAVSPEFDDDELPLTGKNSVNRIKQRCSLQPLREMPTSPNALTRRSMPAFMSPSPSLTPLPNLYPEIPALLTDTDVEMQQETSTPEPELPGSLPEDPASPSFVFGAGNQVSSNQFSDAGMKLLQEMQAKMGGPGFNPELLKGKRAEVSKLVTVNSELGSGSVGGWGLGSQSSLSDRYAAAHEREFSRMKSIDALKRDSLKGKKSAPAMMQGTPKRKHDSVGSASMPVTVNGLPAAAPADEANERSTKRTKMSAASYLGSLRGTKSSIVGKLAGDNQTTPRKRTNLRPDSGRRFGFLRHKKTASDAASIADSMKTEGSYVLPSSKAPADGEAAGRPAASRTTSTSSQSTLKKLSKGATSVHGSLSSQLSTASKPAGTSKTSTLTKRPPIPDFAPPQPTTTVPLKDNSWGHGSKSSSLRSKSTTASTSSLSRSPAAHTLSHIASGTNLRPSPSVASSLPRVKTSRPNSVFGSVNKPAAGTASATGSINSLRRQASGALSTETSVSGLPRRQPSATLGPQTGIPRSTSHLPRSGSTLLAPTAASLARMQATVKPGASPANGVTPTRRPLPQPPKSGGISPAPPTSMSLAPQLAVTMPFGEGSSRSNFLFESNFHMSPSTGEDKSSPFPSPFAAKPKPAAPKQNAARPAPKTPSRGMPSPAKARSTRRARASGLAASKATPEDPAVRVRRAEMRAKLGRMAEERELRRMLGE